MSLQPLPSASAVRPPAWDRLQVALSAAGIGTWHLDLRARIATYDESLHRILGVATGETDSSLEARLARVHPDDRARVTGALEHAIATKSDFSIEFRIVQPDGGVRWLRDRGRVVTGDDGLPSVATGAVMDVTDQHRTEEHERMLADATQSLVAALDYERTLAALTERIVPLFAAACFVHLRDGDALKVVGAAGDARLAPAESEIADVATSSTPVAGRHLLLLPLRAGADAFGTISFVSPSSPFDAHDVALAAELAARVSLFVDRARLFRDLERANHVKDEFLATLSHELRTPLNAVLGWTRMLRRGAVPAERTPAILDTIERNAAAQMQLIEELLDLSAMAAGSLRLNVTRVDLRELLGGAVETIRPAADAKGLRVALTVDESVTDMAADPARLRQVLWNLLANAVKFTPAGGSIEVRVQQGAGDLEIVVRDSGPGICTDFLPYVFEPFRQGDQSAARTTGGLGLGLAIVRHIVEAHGGTVTAHNAAPGAAFVVRLPTGAAAHHHDGAAAECSLRGRRVLAVDDDQSTQDLVATMLLMYGVSVRTAGRSAQALQILSDWRPDVLLTDIAMPGEDGYALIRRVRALPAPLGGIPAVALTAYTDSQSVQTAFAAGFDAHLGKPLEPHVLADALLKVLRARR